MPTGRLRIMQISKSFHDHQIQAIGRFLSVAVFLITTGSLEKFIHKSQDEEGQDMLLSANAKIESILSSELKH